MAFAFVFFLANARAAEEFTISYWCGPPARFNTLERYQEVKAAKFTLAMPACGGMSPEQNRTMLDHCQKAGLKAVVMDGRMPMAASSAQQKAALDAIVKDYADHPALFGYFLVDEPGAGAFPGLAQVVNYLREKDPKHRVFINLLPTYARDFPGALGTPTYEKYVRSFADQVKPFVISYDHYNLTNHGDRGDFFENLDTVRKVALQTKTPFWNIVLATQHGDYRNLTEAELRFEAMQTLAFGGHGLLWFTYWSPEESDKSLAWQHSLIHADGSRDPHYDMIARVNAETKAIGDVLCSAQSTTVYQVGGKPGIATSQPTGGIAPTGPGQFTVGVFKSDHGKTLALVTNRDYKQPLKSQVTVSPASAKVEQFDPAKKSWSPATMPDKGEGEVILDLPAAGGVLLRW